MSFSYLSKEQKQYVVLGVIGALVIIVLVALGIRVSLSTISEAKKDLSDLATKIELTNLSLVKHARVSHDFSETMATLQNHIENAPPEKNYYSWATEAIYSTARKSGLEIEAIEELKIAPTTTDKKDKGDEITMESYSLRITAHGGFNDARKFLQGIEENHHLVRVTGLEISSGPRPESHNVQLYMQWPFRISQIADIWKEVEKHQQIAGKMGPMPPSRKTTPVADTPRPVAEKAVRIASTPVEKPKPPVVKPEPKPAPAIKPEPKPAPVADAVSRSKPVPVESMPVAKKPQPVVVAETPKPEPPKATPKPEPVTPKPVIQQAAPVAMVLAPQPEPKTKPAPEPEPANEPRAMPPVEMPEPVAIAAVPEPKPQASVAEEPVAGAPEKGASELDALIARIGEEQAGDDLEKQGTDLDTLLSTIVEEPAEAEPVAAEPEKQESDLDSLLVAMNPEDSEKPEEKPAEEGAGDAAELEAYIQALAAGDVAGAGQQSQEDDAAEYVMDMPVFVPGPEPISDPLADMPYAYAENGNGAKLLEELLVPKKRKKNESKSLSSFLDSMVEDF